MHSILFEIKPEKLINTPLNEAKSDAARLYIKSNDIDNFVILSEKELFDSNFSIEKYFIRSFYG
jgi:hypothetical protein